MTCMEGLPQSNLYLCLWLAIIQLCLCVANTMLDGRKLSTNDPNPGFISIDCGASNDYLDQETGIWYQTDKSFVETGTNSVVSPSANLNYPYFGEQLMTLRSFPEGKKNCYTLKPKQGKNNTYLIRVLFAYGNYDGKNEFPTFDLYLGVNYWDTIELGGYYYIVEIIHTPIVDTIDICLLETGKGVPFISALELRPLNNDIYQTLLPVQSLLILEERADVGSTSSVTHSRYKDDIYDRLWYKEDITDRTWYNKDDVELWQPFNNSVDIGPENTSDSYRLPAGVLKCAGKVHNLSSALNLDWIIQESKYYVYFHFLEIEKLGPGKKRIINITLNDEKILSEPATLEYLKPLTLINENPKQSDGVHFSISATSESDAPPILNAYEVYKLITPLQSPTDKTDADAILEIKRIYKISKVDWQGDPCLPKENAWEGLICTSDSNPRITSVDLSSSKLTGQIASSFGNLQKLEFLDLSYNELTGELPEFFADLPNLKSLNLIGNKLTGSIPKGLRENADLQLSVANNSGLCLKDSCKQHKFLIPLIASIGVLVVIIMVLLVIWVLRKKISESKKTRVPKQKNRAFSYSRILRITNNLETTLGEGGFGKVYLGTLEDNTQVAVKLLSSSSKQGYKEFQSEAQLLTIIHHRNLVSLIGYCHEGDVKALIYEYMENGDLSQLLSEKNPNVLKWNERLQVVVDAAKGLEYLHNGCKTPIIHRDLKPSNILLNKSMVAKIADFGLSRAFTNEIDSHISTQPAGTPGYIDPEFHRSGNLNKKSDVYSFGIILLQLITGQPPIRRERENVIFILDWVRPRIDCGDIQGIVDPRLDGEFGVASAWKIVETAMACVLSQSTQRPEISYVLQELKECLALEMDHAGIDRSRTSNSLNYTGDLDSITILSAR